VNSWIIRTKEIDKLKRAALPSRRVFFKRPESIGYLTA
jgi:hypothetical protein